jgi:PAS domain S-box-containing protein
MAPLLGSLTLSSELIGAGYVLTSFALLLLLRHPLRHLGKPGSKGFLLAVTALFLWPLSAGVNTFVADVALSISIWNLRLLAAVLVSIGWFLLAFEFTTHRIPSRPVLVVLGGYVLLGQLLAWTNPSHFLVLGPATTVQNGVLQPEFGPWFWMQTVLNYGLIVGATGLLATDWLHSQGLRRRQSALLALAVFPSILANLLTIFGLLETAHDLTPVGLIGSGLILSWTLYRVEFLSVVPVGRDIAVEVMEDAVVTVDDTDRVVDCNAAAQRLFGIEEYSGRPLRDVLTPLPDEVLERLVGQPATDGSDASSLQTEVSFEIRDKRRFFSLTRSPVSVGGKTRLGQVIVFRDITTLKQREEDLDLLRQVLTRILRHNLRTNLNVIEGHAELLAADYDDDRIDRIVSASESLNEISEKTSQLEHIIRSDESPVNYDLTVVANEAADAVRSRYPNVRTTVEAPAHCTVRTPAGLSIAVENLVENAAEHNDAAEPTVDVSVIDGPDGPLLRVADNGPSIPEYELAVLKTREETPLQHGSGIGLWIVRWWADRADVKLTFDTGPEGTTVSIAFPGSSRIDTTE